MSESTVSRFELSLSERREALKGKVTEVLGFAAAIAEVMRDEFGVTWAASDSIELPVVRGATCDIELPITASSKSIDRSSLRAPRQNGSTLRLYLRVDSFAPSSSNEPLKRPDFVCLQQAPIAIGIQRYDSRFNPVDKRSVSGDDLAVYTQQFERNVVRKNIAWNELPRSEVVESANFEAFCAYPNVTLTDDLVCRHEEYVANYANELEKMNQFLNDEELNPRPV